MRSKQRTSGPEIVMVPIEQLDPSPYNPQIHEEEELKRLERSVDEFGWVEAIVANNHKGRENIVISGHARLRIAKRRGETHLPVIYVDEPEHREKALNIALNNPKLRGRTDEAKVAVLLQEIARAGDDATISGYSESEVSRLLEKIGAERTRARSDRETPSGKPRTSRGDLYEIGPHRLLCGDAQDPDDVARLMDGAAAHMVFTDPPYGVSYQDRRVTEDFPGFDRIKGDDLRDEDLVRLLVASLLNAREHTTDDAPFYIWHQSTSRRDFEKALDYVDLEEIGYIVWSKDNFVLSGADYHSQAEFAFYCQKGGHERRWEGARDQASIWEIAHATGEGELTATLGQGLRIIARDGQELYIAPRGPRSKKLRKFALEVGDKLRLASSTDQSDVWTVKRDRIKDYEAPTQKPAALAARAIRNGTRRGQVVLDLFGGSGSTLAAAEEHGRRCYTMEIDEGFCDVIVGRAERHGLESKLVGG